MKRRDFIRQTALGSLSALLAAGRQAIPAQTDELQPGGDIVTVFLGGDVMTGRAIVPVCSMAGGATIPGKPFSRAAASSLSPPSPSSHLSWLQPTLPGQDGHLKLLVGLQSIQRRS